MFIKKRDNKKIRKGDKNEFYYYIYYCFKLLFKEKSFVLKIIPIILGFIGGVVNVYIYQIDVMLVEINKIYIQFGIDIIYGSGITQAKEILKIIKRKRGK